MLTQQVQALQPTQELQMLQLQEREMELLRNNYSAVVTASTLVLGFAYGGCIDFTMPGADPIAPGDTAVGMRPEVLIIFYVLVASSMILETYSSCVATAAVVYGPDMAINGATGQETQQEVACVITRAIGGMRMAKGHIYGSFAAGLVCLLLATCLGTMDKIGYIERMGVSAGWHKVGASAISVVFGGGLLVIFLTFLGMGRVFSKHRLMEARSEHPGEPCVVCGDMTRDGMTNYDRRFLRAPCCPGSVDFKCYQCIGLRSELTTAKKSQEDGCCTSVPKQRPTQRHADNAPGGATWIDDRMTSAPGTPAAVPSGRGAVDDEWDVAPDQASQTLPNRPERKNPRHMRSAAADFGVADQFRPGGSGSRRSRTQ
eukprot:Hpha_TRINITY_DN15222_c5_g12::TRINITY_DN15222_c5_g12_i1::g.66872::m.66872